jgi:hypothetical protein
MVRNQRMPKLTFTITPNPNGYVVVCSEIPYLFTDVTSVGDIDKTIRNLLSEYIDSYPDDAQKRGIAKDTPAQTVWRGSPNSVSLE